MDSSNTHSSSKSVHGRPEDQSTNIPACDECRNRKIKCNRELPICSNCRKAKVLCEFPSRDNKKGSQVKQIANDLATFHERLSVVEGNLAQRIEILIDLVSRSMNVQNGRQPSLDQYTASRVDDCLMDFADCTYEAAESEQVRQRNVADQCGVILSDGSAEIFYGETSTYSHFIHARQSVKQMLEQQENDESSSAAFELKSCFEEVRRLYDTCAMPSYYQEDVDVDDNALLELPPRELLEASVDFYLKSPRIEPPLFQQETLSAAMNEQYTANASQLDESWVLCFNSIILQSMGWVSKIVRNDSPVINCIDDRTLSFLLANTNRALRKIEMFCGLRMVNVQALLLLALVARDYIHCNIFERIFDRACQIAKQMGLHVRPRTGKTPSAKDIERQNIVWLLYLVDKQRIFIRGSSCRFYIFDCNMELPAPSSSAFGHKAAPAYLELACLLEEIYKQLYSPRTNRLPTYNRKERLRQLEKHLLAWSGQYRPELEAKERASREKALLLQLRYAWHVTRLLIASQDSESNSQSRLEIARSALQVVQTLCGGPYIFDGGLLVLERLFCDYSVIAFYEVFGQILNQPQVTKPSDLGLLSTATSALGLLSHPSRADSYCTRLHGSFLWCTNIATTVHNAREQQRKRSLVPLLIKPTSSSSSMSIGRQRTSPAAQPAVPLGHHRDNSMSDWNSDSATSSRGYSALERAKPQVHAQENLSHDHFIDLIPAEADASGGLDFINDVWMNQYLETQDLAMAGMAPGQPPISDFVFDAAAETTNPQMMMANLRLPYDFTGQRYLSSPSDDYTRTPVQRMSAGEPSENI